jgi:integrase
MLINGSKRIYASKFAACKQLPTIFKIAKIALRRRERRFESCRGHHATGPIFSGPVAVSGLVHRHLGREYTGRRSSARRRASVCGRSGEPARESELATCRKFVPAARYYAAARLEADVGLRVNEIRMLDLDDVRWELGRFGKLNVRHGKGARRRGPKPRLVPLIDGADPQPTTTSISTAAPSGRAATPIAVRAG